VFLLHLQIDGNKLKVAWQAEMDRRGLESAVDTVARWRPVSEAHLLHGRRA
jgi:hypothetical protein